MVLFFNFFISGFSNTIFKKYIKRMFYFAGIHVSMNVVNLAKTQLHNLDSVIGISLAKFWSYSITEFNNRFSIPNRSGNCDRMDYEFTRQ